MKKRITKESKAWHNGYFCCLSTLILMNGIANQDVIELFNAGAGNKSYDELLANGVDADDLQILKDYKLIKE